MSSGTVCHSLALFLGLLSLLGYCVGIDPVVTFHGFTSTNGCPRDGVDHIDGTVELDMTGVDTTAWLNFVAIADLSPNDIVSSSFDNCGASTSFDFYCESKNSDIYSFTFHQLAEKDYSGELFNAKINDQFFADLKKSDSKRYPLIRYAPGQLLTIGDETREWNDDGDLEFKLDKLPSTLDITYNVSGIDWTTYRVSILDSSGVVISSSASSVSVTAQVSGSTKEIQVYYDANGCNLTTVVEIEESSPITTPSSTITTPSPNITNAGNSTVPASSGEGLDIDKDDDGGGCDIICIIIIIVCILVAIGVCIGTYLTCVYLRTVKVDCSIDIKIGQVEELVRKIPKIKKRIEKSGLLTMEFYQGTKKLDKESMVENLLSTAEKNKIKPFATVVMCCSVDKKRKTMMLTIKCVKKCTKGHDDNEMGKVQDEKDKDGEPKESRRPDQQ